MANIQALIRIIFSARLAMLIALFTVGTFTATTIFPEVPAALAKKKKKKRKKRKKRAKRKSKKKKKSAAAKKKTVAEPEAEKKEEDPLARKGAASFKVETTIDTKKFDKSAQADAKRDEAIEELKKLIPKAPKSRKAEMIFRLAELYWQKSKFNYGLEMRKLEKDYTNWIDSGRKGREPTQRNYTRQSELIKQNALKLYEKVLNEYPRYRRNDEVLFYLGYN
ncbi:MAG: hypothetical protein VYC39_02480, partial [Myxococcota bacterium]|nr:hypothetical protein [Myxococcota bacterium]